MLTVVQNLAQMQAEQRNQRMNAQFQNARKVMRGNMPKGVLQNGLKRAILENNRLYVKAILLHEASALLTTKSNGNSMANMGRTNKSNMTRARMQRDGSQMDMNGQRAPSPNSNEIAPGAFPNKRPRVEGKFGTDQLGLPLLILTPQAL
jgi:DNA invertase Pin-like site-specific DNA recombinase